VAIDVDPVDAMVSPDTIAAARTGRTRAAIVVHLYGAPAELPDPDDGLIVVEDAAQATGTHRGAVASHAMACSFYPTKNLGGIGDGGAVLTEHDDIADVVRRSRTHGLTAAYVHDLVAQNFRMSELEAAWLRLCLAELDADVERQRQIAAVYREAAPQLRWQRPHDRHSYHLCVFRTARRDALREQLAGAGVATAVHYPLALTQQPAYRGQLGEISCPHAEAWAAECVTVPCFPEMTDGEVERVGEALAALPADTGGGT
jgi:dTDP-4-amino-4,6-dideoxygalactose transaminase